MCSLNYYAFVYKKIKIIKEKPKQATLLALTTNKNTLICV